MRRITVKAGDRKVMDRENGGGRYLGAWLFQAAFD